TPLPADQSSANGLNGHDGHDDLQPLLDAADRLTGLASARPSSDFADRLEAQLFAQAAYLQAQSAAAPTMAEGGISVSPAGAPLLPEQQVPPLLGNDAPTIPGIDWGATYDATAADVVLPDGPTAFSPPRRARWPRVLASALTALLLLTL